MNYTELMRANKRLLRLAKKEGLPAWAVDYVEDLMRRAVWFHDRPATDSQEHDLMCEKALRALCEAQSLLLAYRMGAAYPSSLTSKRN